MRRKRSDRFSLCPACGQRTDRRSYSSQDNRSTCAEPCEELIQGLNHLARANGRSRSEIVLFALQYYHSVK